MLGIDTNILLYSLNPSSQWHTAAVRFLRENFGSQSTRIAIADYVLVELYILLRNPAVLSVPLTAQAARDLATSYLKIPNVMRVENANVMDEVWSRAANGSFPRRRIFDTRLALTLRKVGVTQFATFNTKDFEGLGFERVWNPLV